MDRIHPEVYPQTARMMLAYAQSIDFLNTGSRQIRYQSNEDNEHRMNRQRWVSSLARIPGWMTCGTRCRLTSLLIPI